MALRTWLEMRSETGPVREKNEDSVGALGAPQTRPGVDAVYVVADGLGGHEMGEVASALAVELLLGAYKAQGTQQPLLAPASLEGSLAETLRSMNRAINRAALARRGQYWGPQASGMATTVTAALLAGDALYLGHVGDSRAYLFRKEQLVQLTEDHSWVAEQVRRGLLRPQEAERHPMLNVITQTVGLGEPIVPFTSTQPLAPGDRLLLCTDGLCGFLRDQAIARVLQRFPSQGAVDALIEASIAAGSKDNVTALLVTFEAA